MQVHHYNTLVPDTPTIQSLNKTRDSKESTPVASTPISNDKKSQQQTTADRKLILRENSHETSDRDIDSDRRATVVSSERDRGQERERERMMYDSSK